MWIWMSPIYPCNQILKIHHWWFLTNCHVKPWILNETIHQKWSFYFLKLKFGMLDWHCETKNTNCILYYAKIFEWDNRQFVRLPDPTVLWVVSWSDLLMGASTLFHKSNLQQTMVVVNLNSSFLGICADTRLVAWQLQKFESLLCKLVTCNLVHESADWSHNWSLVQSVLFPA
jgi:hypothetical protein